VEYLQGEVTMTSSVQKAEVKFKFAWMFGRTNDILFYFAPIVLALAVYYALESNLVAAGLMTVIAANGLGLNQLHLGPSWYFYFDKNNQEHWLSDKKRAFMFYVVPIIILLVCTVMGVYQPGLLFLLTTLWGMQHFIQQNFGILALYHNHNCGEAVVSRELQQRSLWASSLFFCSFYFERLMLKGQHATAFLIVVSVLALAAIFYCGLYLRSLRQQVKDGAALNVPALLFWFVSVIYFSPFAFAKYNEMTAFLIPGVMHWSQYMFLNYMLAKYKYEGERAKLMPLHPLLLFALLAAFLFVFSFFLYSVKLSGHYVQPLVGFLFGLSNVHYFQDAFLWRFREEFQRQSILPYIKRARLIESGKP